MPAEIFRQRIAIEARSQLLHRYEAGDHRAVVQFQAVIRRVAGEGFRLEADQALKFGIARGGIYGHGKENDSSQSLDRRSVLAGVARNCVLFQIDPWLCRNAVFRDSEAFNNIVADDIVARLRRPSAVVAQINAAAKCIGLIGQGIALRGNRRVPHRARFTSRNRLSSIRLWSPIRNTPP